MKTDITIISPAVILFLLLVGCAKTESVSVPNSGSDRIGFSVYSGRTTTKADEGTSLNADFNVEGFVRGTTPSLYFESTTYTYNGKGYTGNPEHYWPLEGNLDFYAVSPVQYTNTSGTSVDLNPVDSTLTVTATDGTTDILAAKKTDASKATDSPVSLIFGHKLTKIAFKAVGADTTKRYRISSITVTANSSAKYNYGASENWSDAGNPYTYSFLKSVKTIPVKTKTAQAVGDTLYLMPCQYATVKARVRYSIYEGSAQVDSTTTPVEINLPTTGIWGINRGVVYVLTLNFTSSATPVTFNATQGDWDSEREIDPSHYFDEFGIDWGAGIKIRNVVWAPVNCGYEPVDGDYNGYTHGKMYQWGRKYGQGFNKQLINGDADFPSKEGGSQSLVSLSSGLTNHPDTTDANAGVFYAGLKNWYTGGGVFAPPVDELWKDGEKTTFDPCPSGWRVPTMAELTALIGTNTSPSLTSGIHGSTTDIPGLNFDGGDGTSTSGFVFLPTAGFNDTRCIALGRSSVVVYWSSSVNDTKSYNLEFVGENVIMDTNPRAYAFSVRCVKE